MVIKRVAGLVLLMASIVTLACESKAPSVSPIEITALIGQMRDMAWAEEVTQAHVLIEQQRSHHDQASTGWLVAASWLGRGASFAEQWDIAEQYAREAYDGSVVLLSDRALDAGSQLPTALGAGIEVLSRALDAKGDRAGALEFLRGAHESYKGSSLETRIQKNVLLLSLKGQPFPSLDVEHYLGESTPVSSENLKGKVVVAFFWAHWCPDCKQQLPILEQLHAEYGEQNLAIIGPTQLYGYMSRGQDATPEQELEYLQGAYQERFPIPTWMSVPVSHQNFLDFGVSTTPTLIIIDREGTVQLYNPGTLPYEELSAYVERLLAT